MASHTQPEYAVFYALHAAVEMTRAEWRKWKERADRNHVKTTADWRSYARAVYEYEAALDLLDEFCARMDADARAVGAA